MAKGLLSTIQSWYVEDADSINDSKKTNLNRSGKHGRFIQLILLELAHREPKVFEKIIREHLKGLPLGEFAVIAEYQFSTANRFADLAIFVKGTTQPVALVEIKYNDHFIQQKNHQPDDQLTSYLNECKKNKSKLLILSKNHLLPTESKKVVDANKSEQVVWQCLLGELSRYLNESSIATVSGLLNCYLSDEGLVMESVKMKLLYGFFHRLLNKWDGAGKVQERALALEGANQFQTLLSNMALVGDSIAKSLGQARKPSVDFSIHPYIRPNRKNLKKLNESLENNNEYVIEYQDRAGGHVYVFAQYRLYGEKNKWLSIDCGFCFSVESSKEKTLDASIYACVNSAELKSSDPEYESRHAERKINNKYIEKQISDMGFIKQNLTELIRQVSAQVIDAGLVSNKEHIKILKTLIKLPS